MKFFFMNLTDLATEPLELCKHRIKIESHSRYQVIKFIKILPSFTFLICGTLNILSNIINHGAIQYYTPELSNWNSSIYMSKPYRMLIRILMVIAKILHGIIKILNDINKILVQLKS